MKSAVRGTTCKVAKLPVRARVPAHPRLSQFPAVQVTIKATGDACEVRQRQEGRKGRAGPVVRRAPQHCRLTAATGAMHVDTRPRVAGRVPLQQRHAGLASAATRHCTGRTARPGGRSGARGAGPRTGRPPWQVAQPARRATPPRRHSAWQRSHPLSRSLPSSGSVVGCGARSARAPPPDPSACA